MDYEEITVLSRASKKGRSLRTTFPMSLVKLLRLREGDKIRWEIEAKNGRIIILVKPLNGHKGDEL